MPKSSESISIPSFRRFSDLPGELRYHIWYHALPGPRIIYVKRPLTPGKYAEKEWHASEWRARPFRPEPNYFMSPSSSLPITCLLQTCCESRLIAKRDYTLLFPASATWFSFSLDYLYLDFGQSPHELQYRPRTFTSPRHPQDPILSRFIRPSFNEQLAAKIKKIAIATSAAYQFEQWSNSFSTEFWTVFTGVEEIVLADPLHNMCSEAGEDLIWMRGRLGDELTTRSLEESTRDLESEDSYHRCLRHLELWRGAAHCVPHKDDVMDKLEKVLRITVGRSRPTITRKQITTPAIKQRLLEICGSEESLLLLDGLAFNFICGMQEYKGALSQSQLLSFLEMAFKRLNTSCSRKPGMSCGMNDPIDLMTSDQPKLLARIEALGGGFEGIRLREAEDGFLE